MMYRLLIPSIVFCFLCARAPAEIIVNDVEFTGWEYVDPNYGLIREIEIGQSHLEVSNGLGVTGNSLDAAIVLFEVKLGDIITQETWSSYEQVDFGYENEAIDVGEIALFGYATFLNWQQLVDPGDFQVFGWFRAERLADDGILRILESVGSYGVRLIPEQPELALRFASPGIVAGMTQVPEPSAFHGMLVAFAGTLQLRRRCAPSRGATTKNAEMIENH